MALDPEYKALVESQLDECDAALADKPYLAGIFNEAWRQEHRANMLGADSRADVWYPASYAKPHNDLLYPPDWQQRLEEGASVLLPKLDKRERKHLFSRMRGNGCLSAEEELLLARGFAQVFGPDRIAFPRVGKDKDVPEFHVSIQGTTVEVEAKGLHESEAVRQLNSHAIRTGQLSWITMNPDIDPLRRLRQAIAKKLLSGRTGDVRILVLTQYTPWITPVEAVPLIRGLAIDPGHFGIPNEQHALAIAYVTNRWLTGVWFNVAVERTLRVDEGSRELIRQALKDSFYERRGGVSFHDQQNEAEQRAMIADMLRIAYGG